MSVAKITEIQSASTKGFGAGESRTRPLARGVSRPLHDAGAISCVDLGTSVGVGVTRDRAQHWRSRQSRGTRGTPISPEPIVDENVMRRRRFQHDQIEIAIVVEVADDDPARRTAIAVDSRLLGNWPKRPVAVVVQ